MRWKLKLDSTSEVVDVELLSQSEKEFEFKVGDQIVRLSKPNAFPYSIETNEVQLSLEAWTSSKWRASNKDRTFTLLPQLMGASSQARKDEIRTQMPGRVLKVLVTPGQRVEPRQTLLIIEAMKMENEIRSETESIVESLEVTPGQSVESGTLLLKFKSA